MSKINREALLRQLKSVMPGLSMKEIIEQSGCFVFRRGNIYTYNDEISCAVPCEVPVNGAVQSKALVSLLEKLKDETIEIVENDGEMLVKAKRRNANFRMEKKILLPLDSVEAPGEWRDLPEDFTEAIKITQQSTSTDEMRFNLTCVHIHPDWIEACDNSQVIRYDVQLDIDSPILLRGVAIKSIVGLDMLQYSKTKNWMHFRNADDLLFSCRLFVDKFPDVSPILNVKGRKITLPKGLREAAERAEIFSSDNIENDRQVEIHIRSGRLKILGESSSGRYSETRKVKYDGPPISFLISPKLLGDITSHHRKCVISDTMLFVDGGKYKFATGLGEIGDE